MSERDHTLIEELMSVDALGGLDDADRALLARERAGHGACEECARLQAEFAEVAGRLGLALDPVEIPTTMADDILRAAGAEVAAGPLVVVPGGPDAAAPSSPASDLAGHRTRGSGGSWRVLVAVAAAFALFAGGWVLRDAASGSNGALRLVRFTGGSGTLAMAYEPGTPGAVFFGSDLPDPGAQHVYEIWMIQGDQAPVSGGCVVPEDGTILTHVGANIGSADTMAVTVESASCPAAPTTDPVLTASLA
ncbi:MAG: anti-sigma factor [Actinomycetota bacterium]|nr:anti-sigma factor [Actinomycetota bacterium]